MGGILVLLLMSWEVHVSDLHVAREVGEMAAIGVLAGA